MDPDLTAYFVEYAKGYDDFDAARLVGFYYAPTLMVKTGHVTVLHTAEEIRAHLAGLLASYRERGYRRGNVAGLAVKTQGAWSQVATVHWIIDHVDGSVLRDFHSSYHLFQDAGRWRILSTTNHDS